MADQPHVGARQRWIRAAVLAGIAYLVIGRVFALPTSHVRVWRLAAWAVSGVVYLAHIAYERFRLGDAVRPAAVRVSVGVAIGAFALAVAAMVHSWSTTARVGPVWLLALVLWPLLTAVPAFLVAFVAAAVLERLRRSSNAA